MIGVTLFIGSVGSAEVCTALAALLAALAACLYSYSVYDIEWYNSVNGYLDSSYQRGKYTQAILKVMLTYYRIRTIRSLGMTLRIRSLLIL